MSVDTYLNRKNLKPYHNVERGDVSILVSRTLWHWARYVEISVKGALLWRSLEAEVEALHPHMHSRACGHR